ncbi:hypothetical protein FACS1894125_4040 [Actinomycetota bacterium]|nr:hypothetical protein FACS1894125_4040 [Actinomycetota bacterium]
MSTIINGDIRSREVRLILANGEQAGVVPTAVALKQSEDAGLDLVLISDAANPPVSFTPDLLPSDILGMNVYDQANKQFVFHEGPVFCNVLLADEINRASPKTQSALLEVMAEQTVTLDNSTYPLGHPFMVIATQNPLEQVGTYKLPEAQLDRFGIKTTIGYLNKIDAISLLNNSMQKVQKVFDLPTILRCQKLVEQVYCASTILDYIIRLVEHTRKSTRVRFGVSQRGAQLLCTLAKTYALSQGREYVTPDDIQMLVPVVFPHRIILTSEALYEDITPESVVNELLLEVEVPR